MEAYLKASLLGMRVSVSLQVGIFRSRMSKLPRFEDNSFDMVWACESGEHMPDKKRHELGFFHHTRGFLMQVLPVKAGQLHLLCEDYRWKLRWTTSKS